MCWYLLLTLLFHSTLPFFTLLSVLGGWINRFQGSWFWLGLANGELAGDRGWKAGYFLPVQAPSSTVVSPLFNASFLDFSHLAVTSPWFSVASSPRVHYCLLLVSTNTVHGSVNSPLIKFSTNYPVWLSLPFLHKMITEEWQVFFPCSRGDEACEFFCPGILNFPYLLGIVTSQRKE